LEIHAIVRPPPHTIAAEGGDGVAAGGFVDRFCYAEIGHQGVAAREHHVVGLDVAMHHAVFVCLDERIDHLGDQADRLQRSSMGTARPRPSATSAEPWA
jgi:hypothetical protein